MSKWKKFNGLRRSTSRPCSKCGAKGSTHNAKRLCRKCRRAEEGR